MDQIEEKGRRQRADCATRRGMHEREHRQSGKKLVENNCLEMED